MEKVKHIVFTKKNTAELLESELRQLKANEVKSNTKNIMLYNSYKYS